MGSGKKRTLPVFDDVLGPQAHRDKGPPTVEAARKNLGGRGMTGEGAGCIVALPGVGGLQAVGVVLYASATDLDVWIDEGIVRRVRPEDAESFQGVVSEELLALAADARLFATLREGQRVRYQVSPETLVEGDIVEKCRYGALVLGLDGKLMAVGFRKLWPVDPTIASPN